MKFIFITLFPEQIEAAGRHSMIKRGLDAGLLEMECINPRDFSTDKHRSVDDTPFGGGVGMVLKPGPMVEAIRLAKQKLPDAPVIAMSPGGETFSQPLAEQWARSGQDLILVCGHYEGFDERIYHWVDAKVSIGDYVLTGGELPALIIMDAVSASFPVCWASSPAPKRIPSPRACWNIPSTRGPSCSRASKCPKCCATATTN